MIKSFFDMVLGYFMRILIHGSHEQVSPLIDLDAMFERLNSMKADLTNGVQKAMLKSFVLIATTVAAGTVLITRIYQLSAGNLLGIGGVQIDGAIVFGLILTAIAAGSGYYLFGRKPKISIEETLRQERAKWEREHTQHRQPSSGSPLEEALAMLIQQFVESRNPGAAQASTTQNVQDDTAAESSYEAEKTWESNDHKVPQA